MKRDKILYLLLLRLAKDEFIAMAGHEFSEEEQKYLDILVRLKYIMSYIITSETPNYIGYLIEERGWRFINHYETLYFQKKQSKILNILTFILAVGSIFLCIIELTKK